ncbi:MAG: gamma carbonic anhydrase family protein [Mycobacterium sp.]
MAEPLIIALPDRTPRLAATSWVAPNAAVIGDVTLGTNVSVWYSATLRAEFEPIVVGQGSNVQDSVTIHTDPGFPAKIGERVTIGHNAVLHGCTVEDDCLIGIGSVIGNGAIVGCQSLIAPGAVVPQRMVIPPRSMVAGVPAKVRRELTTEEIEANRVNASAYEYLLSVHRGAVAP